MYAKIFDQIFDSTLAEDYQTRHIFMDLLVLADRTGIVDMTYEAIQRRLNVPMKLVRKAIGQLCQPDLASRTTDHDGRRLIPLNPDRGWGWQIVNFEAYHNLRDEGARREQNRLNQRAHRKREREKAAASASRQPPSAASAHADVYADADKDGEKTPFGEHKNVRLSARELERLRGKLGSPKALDFWIEKLSGYKKTKNKRYKSDYATWAAWGRDWWLREGQALFEATLSPEERIVLQQTEISEEEAENLLNGV